MFEFAMKVKKKSETRTGIPTQLKERIEQSTGMPLDDVRVHYNSVLPARLDALAYAQGNQVEIGPGQEQHLPHELGHVVQQKLGIVRANGRHSSGAALNTDPGLEHQADEIGAGRSRLSARQNTEQGFETVVQRQFNINVLIDGLLDLIGNMFHAPKTEMRELQLRELRRELLNLKAKIPKASVKSVKETLDKYEDILSSKRERIHKLFFSFYNLNVLHSDLEDYRRQFGLENVGPDDNEIRLRDENSLVNTLNDIYTLDTGKALLEKISKVKVNGKAKDRGKAVSIVLEDVRRGMDSLGDPENGDLKEDKSGNITAGPGVDACIYLGAEALNSYYELIHNEKLDSTDPRFFLSHELIHALHGVMGVMPTWDILAKVYKMLPPMTPQVKAELNESLSYIQGTMPERQFQRGGIDNLSFDEQIKLYFLLSLDGTPDDVPTTGIRDNIVYPKPLENIKNINENQIRRELGEELRIRY